MRFLCLFALLGAAPALADVQVTRKINALSSQITFYFNTSGPECQDPDEYGCAKIDLRWASNYSAYVKLISPQIVQGSKIVVDATVEGIIPFKVTCAACGQNCSFKIPIVNTPVTIALPPCPVPGQNIGLPLVIPMPAKSPLPISVPIKANVQLLDPSGAALANVDLTAALSPTGIKDVKFDAAALKEYAATHSSDTTLYLSLE